MTKFSNEDLALLYSIQIDQIMSLKKHKVFLIVSGNHKYVLKEMAYEENDFIISATNYLANNGVSLNRPIKSQNDSYINLIDGRKMMLTSFVDGKLLDYHSKASVAIATKGLAELHNKSNGFHYQDVSSRIKWGSVVDTINNKRQELFSYANHIMAINNKRQLDYAYLDNYKRIIEDVDLALSVIGQGNYNKVDAKWREIGGICHHDLAYHNIFIDGVSSAFIDFDYCIEDIYCHDLCNYLTKLMKYHNYDLNMVEFALNVYDSVHGISEEELNIIKGMMVFPQDFWQIAFSYLVEGKNYNRLAKKMQYNISDIVYRQRAINSLIKL